MKIIKLILIILAGVIVLFLGVSAFMPGESHVERSIVVNAPVNTVFAEVNDFKNWDHWSPWKDYDPEMKNTIEGTTGMPGYKLSWKSNVRDVGSGSLTRVTTSPNSEIENDLQFEGYDGHSRNLWQFQPEGEGTKVTWTNIMPLPIYMRLMAGKMEEMLAPDFEKGLQRIKDICERKPAQTALAVEETTVPATEYMAMHATANLSDISAKIGAPYEGIGAVMQKQGLHQAGPPFAIYYSDSSSNFELDAAIPTDKKGKDDGSVKAASRTAGNALVIHYHGGYEGIGMAYQLLGEYIKQNNRQVTGPPWEEYVTDPMMEKDTSKWLTNVYFPVK